MWEPRHLHLFSPKWTGPIFVAAGLFALVTQVFAWLYLRILHSWLLGGGFGLLMVGAIAWFLYLDDRRSGARISNKDEMPTADDYDKFMDDFVGDTDDQNPDPL